MNHESIIFYLEEQLDKKDAEIAALKEELTVTVDVLKQVQVERDGLQERVRELEAHPKRCICGHYHCPVCGNQTDLDINFETENKRLRAALVQMTNYAECALDQFKDGRGYLDITGFHILIEESREALKEAKND